MRNALLTIALATSALIGVAHANEDGYRMKGTHSDFGSALVNGLVMFVAMAVLFCLVALSLSADWNRWRQKRRRR